MILRKKNHIFSNFRGGARRVRPPPPGSAPDVCRDKIDVNLYTIIKRSKR
jgi:hypothetical protein